MTKKLYKYIGRTIITKLVRSGHHTRRISNEKHASNINICRSIESVPICHYMTNLSYWYFFVDKVCTGMKFALVPKKAQKKEGFSALENFIIHSLAQLFCFQLHSIIHTGILL